MRDESNAKEQLMSEMTALRERAAGLGPQEPERSQSKRAARHDRGEPQGGGRRAPGMGHALS
jgi:hypothetical protein